MSTMIRFLFPLLGFLCTATVITLAAGVGYLRMNGTLDDEHMLRIVSMLHGVDLEKIAEEHETGAEDVPLEELSYAQQSEQRQVATLHLQAKQDDLDKQLREFQSEFKQISVAYDRYKIFQSEVQEFLKQREEQAVESGLVAVRSQLQNLSAKKQAKPLLVDWIKKGRIDDVILILNGLSNRSRKEIIRTFDSPDDVDMLRRIYEQMLAGHPEKPFIEEKLKELEQLKKQAR